ncbi:MAG: hypothetical protein HY903_19605 [Deltaproteobacteria bacterium]|nr:hypothetical protein [Deltaproteobacteria bacterium]
MSNRERLLQELEAKGRRLHGELYLPVAEARSLIERCLAMDLAVSAVELFEWQGEERAPVLLVSDDFSLIDDADWRRYQERCAAAARAVLAQVAAGPQVYVNVVLLERSRWKAAPPGF